MTATFRGHRTSAVRAVGTIVAVVVGSVTGCRPSDVLTVPPPAGVTPSTAYHNQSGAEGLLANGKSQVYQGFAGANDGVLGWSGLLGDEFRWVYFSYDASQANIDARMTEGVKGFQESGDQPIRMLLRARLTLLSAVPVLEQYEPAGGRAKIGEAFALIGYAELLIAEDYCAGVALDALVPVTGVQYGAPLTTDSLLAVAVADFDSAATYAGGDAVVAALAAVGLGRARLAQGQFAAAAAAVNGVSTGFVYNAELQPGGFGSGGPQTYNIYDQQATYYTCGYQNVADRKGGNGINYISAVDPRLVLSTSVAQTCDGLYSGSGDSVWYYPTKFGNPSTYVPLATGIEARLIEAEAALQIPSTGVWAGALNSLRADSADTKVVFRSPLTADSTTTASQTEQVDVMFRERAFWLYGTGARLSDMRRLIRQYGRDQSTVFPTGPYPNGSSPTLPSPLPEYGSDVSLTLPTAASGFSDPNPLYKGCLNGTKRA